MNDIMIDLETLSNKANAAIIAIGACHFDIETGKILSEFYSTMDWENVFSQPLDIDTSTLKWWMQQNDEARNGILNGCGNLKDELASFRSWVQTINSGRDVCPWGNGATFDIVILENAFKVYGMKIPWNFWNIMDVRTAVRLAKGILDKKDIVRQGTHHHALDDAIYQAKYVSAMYQELRR